MRRFFVWIDFFEKKFLKISFFKNEPLYTLIVYHTIYFPEREKCLKNSSKKSLFYKDITMHVDKAVENSDVITELYLIMKKT